MFPRVAHFGACVKEIRRREGLSQRALADLIGLDNAYLSTVESGQRPPFSPAAIDRLVTVLKLGFNERSALHLSAQRSTQLRQLKLSAPSHELMFEVLKLFHQHFADFREAEAQALYWVISAMRNDTAPRDHRLEVAKQPGYIAPGGAM